MEKTIEIGNRQVSFKATASTTRKYRAKFNRDLFVDFNRLAPQMETGTLTADSLECFENIAYIMAKQADDSIPDDPDEWLDQFDMMSIYEVLPQLVELWGANVKTIEEPKKKATGRQSGR